MLKSIVEPVSEYYPIPWWSWTGNMQKPEMSRQLKLMYDQHIREFFIFPCYALEYPVFLQESWWEYVEFTLRECEKLGMKVWIYDDLSWPSGSAGGLAMQRYPHCRMQQLQCRRIPLGAGEVYRHDPASDTVHIGFRSDSGKVQQITLNEEYRWRNDRSENGCIILIVKVFYDEVSLNSTAVAWNRQQRGTVDLLDGDAVEAWMGCIYGEYYRRFAGDFGKTIKGFFCDEPRPNRCDGHSIPWTKNLFRCFREKYGYSLEPRLPEIFFDLENSVEVRRDYWNLVTELFTANFICRLEKWCSERNVLLTGHTAPEEMCFQRNMLVSQGDIQAIVRHMSVPGCDLLGAQTPYFSDPASPWYGAGPEAVQNLILTVKRASSTARYTGAGRVMCEAFGVRSWHGDMQEQKLINDYLAAAGINFINDNSLSYTVSDFRSRITGKHFTQPWWKYYHLFNDCSARLSAFASFGYPDAQTAVLFPHTTQLVLTPADIQENISGDGDLTEAVNRSGNVLLKNHIDFEYIWEYVLKESVIRDGALEIPGGQIRVLILPQSTVVDEQVFAKLQEFAAAGGKVIAAGKDVQYILPEKGEKYAVRSSGFTVVPLDDGFEERLLREVRENITGNWTLDGDDSSRVVTSMRKLGNSRILLVANQLPGSCKLTLRHSFDGEIMQVSPENGTVKRLAQRRNAGMNESDIVLEEDQSMLLAINIPADVDPVPADVPEKSAEIALDSRWDFSPEPANHFLPDCVLRLDPFDTGEAEKWYCSTPEKDNSHADKWLPVRGGKSPIGLSPEESGFYWLAGNFHLENIPGDLTLIADNPDCVSVYVNGKAVRCAGNTALWDQHNRIYPCAAHCRIGENRFFVKVRTSAWFSPGRGVTGYYEFKMVDKYPMTVVLSGSFGVKGGSLTALPEKINTQLAWNSQGFPFFAGTGVYRQKFFLNQLPKRAVLRISAVRGTVSVTVNRYCAGAKAWGPREFELPGDILRHGENEIILKVAGSLGNILQRSYGDRWTPPADYGLIGDVTLSVIEAVEKQ
ncbi:MAG: hypothetical protein E7057_03895 [Lentisphaerae bacterium]|nr:hypothetical protein [Lentisphaerota bacterium]